MTGHFPRVMQTITNVAAPWNGSQYDFHWLTEVMFFHGHCETAFITIYQLSCYGKIKDRDTLKHYIG